VENSQPLELEKMAKLPKHARLMNDVSPWKELVTKLHQENILDLSSKRMKMCFRIMLKARRLIKKFIVTVM
jgi:hypothetical protein